MDVPEQKARRRRLSWIAGAGVALVLVLLVALSLAARRPPQRRGRLTDGSTVTVQAVTWGTEERVVGSPLQTLLYRLLPTPQNEWSGARAYRGGAPRTLTFWVTRQGAGSLMPTDLEATTFDEHGNESSAVQPQGLGNGLERWEFRAFPRRGRITGLRFYQRLSPNPQQSGAPGSSWARVGEITAPNPTPGPHPQWTPPPLPVTVSAGDVQVTLTRLEAGVDPESTFLSPGPAEVYCRASFDIRRHGKRTREWSTYIQSISDATGNTWNIGSTAFSEVALLFPSPPWPGEEAWKLRVQLTRNSSAKFAADELWQVDRIPIPGPGRGVPLARQATVQGVALELVGIYGMGAPMPEGFEFTGPEKIPVLLLRVQGSSPRDLARTFIRARDDRGREVRVNMTASTSDERESRELLRVEAAPDAKWFEFTYAVHRVRYVEILAPKVHGKHAHK